jgi:hypothetical protein
LLHIFIAAQLRPVVRLHDEEEELELVRLPLERAIDQVMRAEVSDAKTVAGLLAYYRMSSGRSTIAR